MKKIEKLKSYIVKFKKDSILKAKIYLFNYIIRKPNWCPIIVISYDGYIFSTNDDI